AVWDRVEEKLDQDKKKRVIPIWKYFEIKNGFKLAGVAATLLLIVTLGGYFIKQKSDFNLKESENQKIVIMDTPQIQQELDSANDEEIVALELMMPEKEAISNSESIQTRDGKTIQEVLKNGQVVVLESEIV